MKASIFKLAAILCVACTLSCQNKDNVGDLWVEMGVNGEQLPLLRLKGTKWKLEGLYYSETNRLKEFESENCKECYTFTFITDTTAVEDGGSIDYNLNFRFSKNSVESRGGNYYEYYNNMYLGFCGYKGLYHDLGKLVNSYSISRSEIRLYIYDSEGGHYNGYLLLKPFCSSCPPKKPAITGDDETRLLSFNLKGTKWKLEGINNMSREIFKTLEPIDCEECHTITFDTNNTAKGFAYGTPFSLVFSEKSVSRITPNMSEITPLDEMYFMAPLDAMYYNHALLEATYFSSTSSFTISETELILYSNFCYNLLIFKKIKQ